MATLLIAQRNADLDAHNAKLLAQFALEADPETPMRPLSCLGDEVQLRGLPAIGRAVQGAIRGTRPGSNLR